MELIVLFFSAALINNVILAQFLGLCPFLGVSKKTSSALGMGAAIILVIFSTSVFTWIIYHLILTPLEIQFMDLISFILLIAATVQILEMFIKKFAPGMYKAMGIYLPLITTNCAVLGTALVNIRSKHTWAQMLTYSLAIPVGYAFIIFLFSSIRERIELSPVPRAFRGTPIALFVAAIMGAAMLSLQGIF